MGRRLVARHPTGTETLPPGQRYEDDSLSFCSLKKDVASLSARAPTDECSGAQSAFLEYNMHGALKQKHKGVPMLALAPEPEVLNKEPELAAIVAALGGAPSGPISSTRSDKAAIVTAPGGASRLVPTCTRPDKVAEPEDLNKVPAPSWPWPVILAMAKIGAIHLAMSRWALATWAARQAKQLGNPSCLDSKAATASSLPQTGIAPSAGAGNRHGDARGAAREGSAGTRRPANQRQHTAARGSTRRTAQHTASHSSTGSTDRGSPAATRATRQGGLGYAPAQALRCRRGISEPHVVIIATAVRDAVSCAVAPLRSAAAVTSQCCEHPSYKWKYR
jgi:hypothetical protein